MKKGKESFFWTSYSDLMTSLFIIMLVLFVLVIVLLHKRMESTIVEKEMLLRKNHIAVWDVIASCDIEGSSDSSIKNVVVNDLSDILEKGSIEHIFVNGKKAEQLYKRYLQPATGREAVCLPSTSPANASWSLDRLIEAWGIIKES